ncbi:exosome complex component MTR3-like [Homarus americanus]|uniref:Exosome complex component MTR3-like n=1 Tax=Homarus americanus TaxID=6706 RepID=A0A8J5N065_HOMAM|nr:exosome complex component MTR3-like [Homarus americanus]XP_042219474.1 exosome complex component MTR3-like [Homarus americanus]XP_042219475.1 exosome complex component MTR3-like [Homarus americanus]XP_042219476.1 exosome complex component MTR3-like [Homarus americanus]KAG7170483.1 Exosome complex component MTR3-like [Homarus americanus]
MGSRDTRRIMGPEKSIPYSLLQTQEKSSFLGEDSSRRDARSAVDPRKYFMSLGVISQAKGSSYLEVGNTKVCCGVYGPMDVQRGSDFNMSCKVLCEVKMAPFSCLVRRSPQPDKQQKEMSRQLKDALETVIILDKFPKSQIDVYVTVIEDDGGLLAACITAAGLALCHANIDVYDLVIGATVLWHNGILYADPTHYEEEYEGREIRSSGSEGGQLTVGMMPKYANGQVTLLVQGGQVSADNLCEGLEVVVEICQRIYNLSRKTLVEYVEQSLEENEDNAS